MCTLALVHGTIQNIKKPAPESYNRRRLSFLPELNGS